MLRTPLRDLDVMLFQEEQDLESDKDAGHPNPNPNPNPNPTPTTGRVLICGRATCPVRDLLFKMNDLGLIAVPVVDDVGALLGNFSLSDLRGLTADHFSALALPVGEYLALQNHTEFLTYASQSSSTSPSAATATAATSPPPPPPPPPPPMSVAAAQKFDRATYFERKARGDVGVEVGQTLWFLRPDSTLKDALGLLVTYRLHRAYVVDAWRRPVGVVSLTDLLKILVGYDPLHPHHHVPTSSHRGRVSRQRSVTHPTRDEADQHAVGVLPHAPHLRVLG